MIPFWVLSIIRQLTFRGPEKKDHDFDNHLHIHIVYCLIPHDITCNITWPVMMSYVQPIMGYFGYDGLSLWATLLSGYTNMTSFRKFGEYDAGAVHAMGHNPFHLRKGPAVFAAGAWQCKGLNSCQDQFS